MTSSLSLFLLISCCPNYVMEGRLPVWKWQRTKSRRKYNKSSWALCVWVLNATCYIFHMITARLLARVLMQKKARSVMYHSCLTLMLTQQSSGAGLPLKAWVDSPRWNVSSSPQSPITLCYITSRYQGAFALFVCDSHFFSPLLSREKSRNKMKAANN